MIASLHTLLLLFALVACLEVTLSDDPTYECGINTAPPKTTNKPSKQITNIIGGQEAATHGWPWQIMIFLVRSDSDSDKPKRIHCGGSIISKRYIVTAAHCIFDSQTGRRYRRTDFELHAGRHDTNVSEAGSQVLQAEKIIVHNGYESKRFKNDIALIKLKIPMVWSRMVRPVCLPKEDPRLGQICVVTGWGKTKTGHPSRFLQQVYMPIADQTVCTNNYLQRFNMVVTEKQICAGSGDGKKDSCRGDSGGPLVCRRGSAWSLVGVVSAGTSDCAVKGFPGIYTRLTAYTEWIADTIKANGGDA